MSNIQISKFHVYFTLSFPSGNIIKQYKHFFEIIDTFA